MNLSLYIAKRYLFSKKSHQVINIISGVAIAGIALATAAMICTLSVFNGFQSLVAKQFTAFDPDIKITAAKGKSFLGDSPEIAKVTSLKGIHTVSFGIEDKALVVHGKQVMATVKGVDSNFTRLTSIEDALYGDGQFILQDSLNFYAIMGAELLRELGCGIRAAAPLEVYAPNRGKKINLTMPARNFKKEQLHLPGLIFAVNQPKYDAAYIITSIDFARKLFRRNGNEATYMDIKAVEGTDIRRLKRDIEALLGEEYTVQDRYEQQDDVYKVMQIEKLISYIFLAFIMLVACFNIVGSLSMLIIEKRDNMETLRSMGAERNTISNIFVYEGIIISAIGAVAGVAGGLALCLLQQHCGVLSMGDAGSFVVDSYPVEVHLNDIATTFITVLAVGITAVWLPVRILTRKAI